MVVEEREQAAREALQVARDDLSKLQLEHSDLQVELHQLEGAIDEVLAEQEPLKRKIAEAEAELADINRLKARQLSLFGDD